MRPADAEVEDLLHYDPETAGGIMSTGDSSRYRLKPRHRKPSAIALQEADDVEMAFYVYVVNDPVPNRRCDFTGSGHQSTRHSP